MNVLSVAAVASFSQLPLALVSGPRHIVSCCVSAKTSRMGLFLLLFCVSDFETTNSAVLCHLVFNIKAEKDHLRLFVLIV